MKILQPLIKVPPFVNPGSKHWLDDFEGDLSEHEEVISFYKYSLFTSNPDAFHAALLHTEHAHKCLTNLLSTYSFCMNPQSC